MKMTNICGSNQSQQFLLATLLNHPSIPQNASSQCLRLARSQKKVSSPLRTGFNVVNPIVYTTPYPICIPCPIYSNLIYQLHPITVGSYGQLTGSPSLQLGELANAQRWTRRSQFATTSTGKISGRYGETTNQKK